MVAETTTTDGKGTLELIVINSLISTFLHGFRRGGRQDGSRIFVALFDYDPPTMSPNPEACDEELPFREGQLIKVTLNNPIKSQCLKITEKVAFNIASETSYVYFLS